MYVYSVHRYTGMYMYNSTSTTTMLLYNIGYLYTTYTVRYYIDAACYNSYELLLEIACACNSINACSTALSGYRCRHIIIDIFCTVIMKSTLYLVYIKLHGVC